MKKSLLASGWLILVFLPALSKAQQRFAASIGSINKEGFYRVALSPLITVIARPDYGDLRILNQHGKQVPFILAADSGRVPGKRWVSLPVPKVIQVDSTNKNTYVQVLFDQAYIVEKLALSVSGPRFYNRAISFPPDLYRNTDQSFFVSSKQNNSYEIDVKSKLIQFTIHNGDNPPLKIDSVTAWQRYRGVISYLKKGEVYRLVFGDTLLLPPEYDLGFFKDSVLGVKDLVVGPIITIQHPGSAFQPTKKGISQELMWILILAVIGILLVFTLRMTKEIKSRNTQSKDS